MLALTFLFSTIASVYAGMPVVNASETGTTYYVSSVNGSDRNSGTSENEPFYSLQKINEIELKPGDRVLLEAGSVFNNGYLHIKGSGSESAPIIIGKYGEGNDPVIAANGQGVWYQNYGKALDNSGHRYKGYVSSCILLYDVEYIEISDIEMTNIDVFDGVNYSSLDKMNRTGVAVVAKDRGTLDHIYLKNLYIHDIHGNVYDKHMNNGGIYFTVFKPEDEASTGISRYNDVLIENCRVENVSRWGIAVGYTAYWDKFTTSEIPDSISETYGSTNVVIRNNYVKEPGGDAITTMYCHCPIVEYNVSDGAAREINTQVYSETSFGRVAAAIWPWKCKDAIFQYNEAFDTYYNQDGQAWDADYGDGTIYQFNYSHNNGGGCVMVCGVQAINTVFRYNISQNDLSGILNIPGNPKAHFYNNVFYTDNGTPFIRTGMTGGTAVVENNIIYNGGGKTSEDWTKNSNVTYSHNIYYNYSNIPSSDKYAITADPRLVNPGSGPTTTNGVVHSRSAFEGYMLQPDSPAINAGKIIENNGTQDFFGRPLDEIPDIGVYEVGDYLYSNDSSIKSTVYMTKEDGDKTVLLVPSVEGNPTTAAELLSNITIHEKASAKLVKNGQDVSAGTAVDESMVLVITAEDNTSTSYPIEIKNTYNYAEDYTNKHQGNVWFYQRKDNGVYSNLTRVDEWGGWAGDNYATVAIDVKNGVTWGLLCDVLPKSLQSEGYSMAFRAPKSGRIEIMFYNNMAYLRHATPSLPNSGGYVNLYITKNGETIDGPLTLPNDGSPRNMEPYTLDVNKGDYIRVEIRHSYASGASSMTRPSVHVTPIISYVNVPVNPVQQVTAFLTGSDKAILKGDYAVVFSVDTKVPLTALYATINYDAEYFEFRKVDSVLEGAMILAYDADVPGKVRVIIGTEGKGKEIIGAKDIFSVTLEAKKSFNLSEISGVNIEVSDANGTIIGVDNVSKTVVMEESVPGDLNSDGEVNIGDLGIAAGFYGVDKDDPEWTDAKKADVVSDGRIDISDLIYIVVKILGI